MDKGITALLDSDNMVLLFRAIGFDASLENFSSIKSALSKAVSRSKIIYLSSSFYEMCKEIIDNISTPYPIVTLLDTSRDSHSSLSVLESQAKGILGENFSLKEINV